MRVCCTPTACVCRRLGWSQRRGRRRGSTVPSPRPRHAGHGAGGSRGPRGAERLSSWPAGASHRRRGRAGAVGTCSHTHTLARARPLCRCTSSVIPDLTLEGRSGQKNEQKSPQCCKWRALPPRRAARVGVDEHQASPSRCSYAVQLRWSSSQRARRSGNTGHPMSCDGRGRHASRAHGEARGGRSAEQSTRPLFRTTSLCFLDAEARQCVTAARRGLPPAGALPCPTRRRGRGMGGMGRPHASATTVRTIS